MSPFFLRTAGPEAEQRRADSSSNGLTFENPETRRPFRKSDADEIEKRRVFVARHQIRTKFRSTVEDDESSPDGRRRQLSIRRWWEGRNDVTGAGDMNRLLASFPSQRDLRETVEHEKEALASLLRVGNRLVRLERKDVFRWRGNGVVECSAHRACKMDPSTWPDNAYLINH